MLYIEIISIYSKNHSEHIRILCGQNSEIFVVHTYTTIFKAFERNPSTDYIKLEIMY